MSILIDLKHFPLPALKDLIKSANENGEVALAEDGAIVARIVSANSRASHGRFKRRAGSAKGLITIPDDFKAPLDEFKEYM